MIKLISYLWRLFAVAILFAIFYLSSFFMVIFVSPVLRLSQKDKASQMSHVQWIIHKFFFFFVRLIVLSRIIRLETRGAELARECKNTLVMANHPSYLDVVILLSILPKACCVINNKLMNNPFIGKIVLSANYISNDSEAERLIEDCVSVIKQDCPLIIFPEGTRSTPNKTFKFHRGSAHVAIRSGAKILPVVIRCEPPFLAKGTPWYKIQDRPSKFVIEFCSPITISEAIDCTEPNSIAARKLIRFLETYYSRELEVA